MATTQEQAARGTPSLQVAYGDPAGGGLVVFAAVMLGVLSLFNGLDGIAAVYGSHVFVGNATYVFGDLHTWGWVMIALAVAQGVAALGVLAGNELARWFGVAVLGLDAFAQMAFIPSYPAWSVLIIALDVVAVYALTGHWARQTADQGVPTGSGADPRAEGADHPAK